MSSLFRSTSDILIAYGIRPLRRLGQNFLVNPIFLSQLTTELDLKPTDHVLEIGPGIGSITEQILSSGASVTAVELDSRLEILLRKRFKTNPKFFLIMGDAAKTDFPPVNKVMGNLPFSSAAPILFNLAPHKIPLMVLTFQDEFVQRLLAEPGTKHYGRLSIMCKLWFNIEKRFSIPPSAFFPKPKVLSTTVRITPQKQRLSGEKLTLFQAVANYLFIHRRQLLRKVLKLNLKRKDNPPWLLKLSSSSLFGERRVFTLTVDEIIQLVDWINEQH